MKEKGPNQASEPTSVTVTFCADAQPAPVTLVAHLKRSASMKILGFIMIIFGFGSLHLAVSALSVGVHSTSRLWQHIEPLSDAAIDAAKDPGERRQRYREVSIAKRELEVYALEADSEATRAGMALTVIAMFQFTLGAVFVIKKKRPNQPPQRNAGIRPSSGDSSAPETPSSLGPRG